MIKYIPTHSKINTFLLITIILLSSFTQQSTALYDRSRQDHGKVEGWSQLGSIIQSEQDAVYNGLGHSVASSEDGKIVVVGAPYLQNNAGLVSVYQYNTSAKEWKRLGRPLYGSEPRDYFGFDVAINGKGNAIVVSAPPADGGLGIVSAYRFDSLEQEWEQVGSNIEGSYEREEFGYAVAMSETGDYIAIGAPRASSKPGRVAVFKYSDNEWNQVGTDIEGESDDDAAGQAIDILEHGKDVYVAVGAPLDLYTQGTATVYQLENSDSWSIMGRYVDGDDTGTDFGQSVSLAHNGKNVLLAVGFPGPGIDEKSDPLSGVQVYSISPSDEWKYYGQMIFPAEQNDDTGDKVSLSRDGNILAITSPEYGEESGSESGLVRIYKFDGNKYNQLGGDIYGEDYDELGFSVSVSKDGKVVTVGSIARNYVISFAVGHKGPSASRSALAIIVLTFFISFVIATCGYALYRYAGVGIGRGVFSKFSSVPSTETPQPSTQMMTFPVQGAKTAPSAPVAGVESDDEDEEDDDDGVSYADDDIDYETHLRQII